MKQRQHLELPFIRVAHGGSLAARKSGTRKTAAKARIMDTGPWHSGHVVSPGPVAAPTPSPRGRHTAGLCQRRDGRVAQQPVDLLGLGVGVPTRRPGRSGGLSRLDGLPHLQALLSDYFEIGIQGLAWRRPGRCLTASGNLNWAHWQAGHHWQAQITTRFKVVADLK